MPDDQKKVFEFDEFRLDLMKRQLTRAGELVPLYSKAFDLLVALVQNDGRDVTKEELFETVWPGQMIEDANLTVTMSAVRKALGERAATPRFIVTIPGHGYRFVGRERVDDLVIERETISQITVDEESGEPESSENQFAQLTAGMALSRSATEAQLVPAPPGSAATQSNRWPLIVTALVAGVVVLGSAMYVARRTGKGGSTPARFAQVKVEQVTTSGKIVNAAFSPDGKLFSFVNQESEDRLSLHLGQLNGGRDIELIPAADALYRGLEYSADGANLYYGRQENGQPNFALYRISVLGGAPIKLRDNINPSFTLSPGEREIAFERAEAANMRAVVVSSLNGDNERTLNNLPSERKLTSSISWSPDGKTIALAATRDAKENNLCVMLLAATGGELKPLTAPTWRTITRIVWLKDGSGLAIIGAAPEEGAQLWFVDFPSGESRRVTNEVSVYDTGLSVGTDSNRLVLVQQKQITNLWVAPANDLNKARQLTFTGPNITFGAFAFDWLAQNRIVYAAPTGQSISLMTMNADGKEVKEISPPGSDAEPSTPADGRFIAFQSGRGGSDQIWRTDPDGGNAKQLTTCGQSHWPSVSPDGKWVVFISDCNGSNALWRVSSDGDQAKRLTDRAVNWPWFSPDGKWIAGIYRSDSGKANVAIFPSEGGAPAKLFDLAPHPNVNYRIRWTPDGGAVVYRAWSQGLWRQNLSGGPPQRIPGIPEDKIGGFGWSHDGTLFGFGRVSQFRDVVMITNSN